jgi:hypothetical protein
MSLFDKKQTPTIEDLPVDEFEENTPSINKEHL